jgi:hypothetical protein
MYVIYAHFNFLNNLHLKSSDIFESALAKLGANGEGAKSE